MYFGPCRLTSRQRESSALVSQVNTMKPATIFDLIIKSFGVYLLCQAISALGGYFAMIGMEMGGSRISRPGLIHVLVLAGAAVWFLYGAHPIQNWAYPKSSDEADTSPPVTPKPQGPFCVSCGKPIPVGSKNCPTCGWTQPGS